jgi:hypothetical protein
VYAGTRAVLTCPVDTDMSRGVEIPKASPESVARAIFDGVDKGEEDIFPDPMSQSMAESWRGGAAKALERQYAAIAEAEPVDEPAGELLPSGRTGHRRIVTSLPPSLAVAALAATARG